MDRLRLKVEPVPDDSGGGFEVRILVNDVDITRAGAGLGMDPYDVLIPVNRFEVSDKPRTVPVARCSCGVYGCGMSDATITQEERRVRWVWSAEVPMSRAAVFETKAYTEEVRRLEADHSWETEERAAGRLLLSATPPNALPEGLRFDWVGNDWRNHQQFQVCLRFLETHQVFLSFPWVGHSPPSLAAEIERVLTSEPPSRWSATWHSITPGGDAPSIAGPAWRRAQL